jgi:hypothetical protein
MAYLYWNGNWNAKLVTGEMEFVEMESNKLDLCILIWAH